MSSRAFTLIEILITVSIIGIVIATMGRFSSNTFYFGNIFQKGLNQADEARRVLRPMANEIRSASPSSGGAYPIESAGTTSFIFFTDVDNNGLEDRVRYFLSGTTLRKGITKPTGTPVVYNTATETVTDVVQGVRNGATPVFDYYDSSYTGTSAPLTQPVTVSVIRLVKVTLIIDEDPNRTPGAVTVTTQVTLRNLKDNL